MRPHAKAVLLKSNYTAFVYEIESISSIFTVFSFITSPPPTGRTAVFLRRVEQNYILAIHAAFTSTRLANQMNSTFGTALAMSLWSVVSST